VNARTLTNLTTQLFASSRGASSLGYEFPDALVPAHLRLIERVRAEVGRKNVLWRRTSSEGQSI
jgi:hypothetical protein